MEELKNKSVEYGLNAIVFTFDVPPSNTVNHRQGKVLTTNEEKLKFVELRELQPYHWTKAYPAEEMEHWEG